MERKYRDITSFEMEKNCYYKDEIKIMRQIAFNLAHIADELAESNRIGRIKVKSID